MYFDSCLPKVQVKLSNLLVYEGLATISLTFTSQARKQQRHKQSCYCLKFTITAEPGDSRMAPQGKCFKRVAGKRVHPKKIKPYVRANLWQTIEIPFLFLCRWLLPELASILPPEVLQPTSNLTYQDRGGDGRNHRFLENIYISSCNYLAEIIIGIKNCWYLSSWSITKSKYYVETFNNINQK